MEILKKDNKVKRIYFLSDIHIKNDPIHNNIYYSVFDNLYKKYNNEKVNKDDLIVITGDIMDCPYHVTGTAIEMAKNFYINLSNYCPVITILGNHDLKTNVDTLTPIVKEHLKTKNELYFLLDNKVYLYGQIAFGHTRFDSKKVTLCKEFNKNYISIALYHGMMKGNKINEGNNSRDCFSLIDFKEYKYCAFGDIHKQEFLRKDKTAFYTGSLIAQNRTEDAFNHGTMKLDLNKEKIEFIQIQNDYKKLELILDDDGNISNYDINKILKSTKTAELCLTFGNTYKKEYSDNIKKIFFDNGVEVSDVLHKNTMDSLIFDTVLKINGKELKLSNVKNSKDIFNFIKEYCKLNHKMDNENRFDKNLNLLLKDIVFDDLIKQKRNLKILSMNIDNIMVYGKDVNVNFINMNGVYGICETNSSGKSTFCEAFSLTLFGNTPRCNNAYSFVRNNQKEASITIKLTSNDIDYEITRYIYFRGDKEMKLNKVNENLIIKKYIKKNVYVLYSITDYIGKNNDIDEENIIYKKKDEMINIIENEIITYDEIYQMLVMSQSREKSFLDDKHKDELLLKMGNLSYLKIISDNSDKLYSLTKNSIKDTIKKHCSKEFYDNNISNHIKVYEYAKNKLSEYEKKIKEYDENKNIKNKELNDIYFEKNNELIALNERMKLYNEFKDIDDEYDINELTSENKELELENKEFVKKIEDFDKTIKQNEINIKNIQKELKKYTNIEDKNKKFNEKQKKNIGEMRKQLIEYNKFIKNIRYKNITKKEYNKYIKDKELFIKRLNEYNDRLIFYKNENNKVNTINGIKNIVIDYEAYNKLLNEKNELNVKLNFISDYNTYFKTTKDIKNDITKLKKELYDKLDNINNTLNTMNTIKNNYESIKKNINYDAMILEIENNIRDINKSIEENTDKIEDYKQNEINKDNEEKIIKLEKQIEDEEEKVYEDYNIYQDLNKELNKFEKELSNIKINREKTLNNKSKNDNDIKENKDILERIIKDKDNYVKYCDIKKQLKKKTKEFNNIEKEYNEYNKLLDNSDIKMNDLKEKCIIANNIIKKCGESIDDINDFELLVNVLKNNGLCDKLLKEQIIVNLQKAIDDICKYIGHEKINIYLENTTNNATKKYIIIIKTDTIKDIANAGGFQKNIMELIFKLAFLRINCYFKSDLIIIDEIFDACSEENKSMAIKLLEYYKLQYNKILLVSHNQSIINTFDNRIVIKRDNINGNSIEY